MVESFIIKKSGSGWENTIKCFYSSLIGLITSSSIDLEWIQLVGVDNLELKKERAFVY